MITCNEIITNMDELKNEDGTLLALAPAKKGNGYRVYYCGAYDPAKAMKSVNKRAFFVYYADNRKKIAEGVRNKYRTSSAIRGHVVSDAVMQAAGFTQSRIKKNEYFYYNNLTLPMNSGSDVNVLITVHKDTEDVDIKVMDSMSNVCDYRDEFNTKHTALSQMVMMQIDFLLSYFNSQGIVSGYKLGDFVC